jgi:hypothetical protein
MGRFLLPNYRNTWQDAGDRGGEQGWVAYRSHGKEGFGTRVIDLREV